MSAAVMTQSRANLWLASLYAGIITAIPAAAVTVLVGADQPILAAVAFLLTGLGPVLGYQFAGGRSGIGSIIGGLIGGIPVLGILLWPILVGAMTSGQSVGKLLVGSLISLVLALVVWGALSNAIGQDPANFGLNFVIGMTIWAGGAAAFMAGWGK